MGRVSGLGEGLVPVSWLSGWGRWSGLLALTRWVLQAGHWERPEQACCLHLGSQKQNLGQNVRAISLFRGSDRGRERAQSRMLLNVADASAGGTAFPRSWVAGLPVAGPGGRQDNSATSSFLPRSKGLPREAWTPLPTIMFMGTLNGVHRVSPMEALGGGGGAWAVGFCPTELEASRAEKGPVWPRGSDSFVSEKLLW